MNIWICDGRAAYARYNRWYKIQYIHTHEMSNVEYVDIIKVALFKVTSDTFIKSI